MSEKWMEALAWVGAFALILGMFWLLVRDNARSRRRSVEEFERDVEANRGSLMRAGALGLEKVLSDQRRAAIEYRIDQEQGTTKTGGKGDDEDRTAEDEDAKGKED